MKFFLPLLFLCLPALSEPANFFQLTVDVNYFFDDDVEFAFSEPNGRLPVVFSEELKEMARRFARLTTAKTPPIYILNDQVVGLSRALELEGKQHSFQRVRWSRDRIVAVEYSCKDERVSFVWAPRTMNEPLAARKSYGIAQSHCESLMEKANQETYVYFSGESIAGVQINSLHFEEDEHGVPQPEGYIDQPISVDRSRLSEIQ